MNNKSNNTYKDVLNINTNLRNKAQSLDLKKWNEKLKELKNGLSDQS